MSKTLLIKAKESLQATKILFENKLYNDAVSRAYYACFQVACVALHQYDIINIDKPKTKYRHQTIIGLFVKKLIHEKQIYPREIRSYLYQLQDGRLIADYEPHIVLSVEETTDRVHQAIYFYETVKESLQVREQEINVKFQTTRTQ